MVVGCGGVGLNAVQGARIAGAERIIAVDRVPSKLKKAALFGATDLVDAGTADPVEAVMQLTRRGADVGIEVIGRADTIAQTSAMTRRGGQVVLVGVPPMDVHYPVPVGGMIFSAQHVIGCAYGNADIHRDIPHLVEALPTGRAVARRAHLEPHHTRSGQRRDGRHPPRRGRTHRHRVQAVRLTRPTASVLTEASRAEPPCP